MFPRRQPREVVKSTRLRWPMGKPNVVERYSGGFVITLDSRHTARTSANIMVEVLRPGCICLQDRRRKPTHRVHSILEAISAPQQMTPRKKHTWRTSQEMADVSRSQIFQIRGRITEGTIVRTAGQWDVGEILGASPIGQHDW